jgi:hypothetical protein
MNRLEVNSAVDQSSIAHISIPRVTSAELSADGTTVWAGTGLNEIVAVDTSLLQVKSRYEQAGFSPLPARVFDRPVEVLSLATGQCFVRLRQSNSPEAMLALWNPASNAMTDLTPAASVLFQNGLGPMARTGDHSAVMVATNDSSGNVAVFAPDGAVSVGPRSLGSGSIGWVAANSNRSRSPQYSRRVGRRSWCYLMPPLIRLALTRLRESRASHFRGMTICFTLRSPPRVQQLSPS